jgi:hypothetical protein
MATARQHLTNNHQQEGSHWSAFAKGLTELGTQVHQMYKEVGMKGECKAGEAVDKLAALAQSHADYHGEAAEECMKAADSDMSKLAPTQLSLVTSTVPGIRPVTRFGQKPIQKPNVDLEFAGLVKIETGDDY